MHGAMAVILRCRIFNPIVTCASTAEAVLLGGSKVDGYGVEKQAALGMSNSYPKAVESVMKRVEGYRRLHRAFSSSLMAVLR